jgi:hypothetical protein
LEAFKQSGDSAVMQLSVDTEWALAPSDFQLLEGEYELGRQFLELGLKLKTSFWGKLPWLLAGLAHPSASLARRTARSCVALWDTSGDERHLHHRLTKEFLDPAGTLRRDIDLFAQGTPLSNLSERTQQRVACMKFWPTVERTVEAAHKDMKMHAGHHRAGPVSLSMAVRATTVLDGLLNGHGGPDCGQALDDLLECITLVRHIRKAPELLCLGRHPVVQQLREGNARSSHWMRKVAEVVYRCDVDEMFIATGDQQRNHKRKIERVRRQVKAVLDPRPLLSASSLLAHALTEHLREVLSEDSIVSLPAIALQGLSEAISHGPLPSAGQQQSRWSVDEGEGEDSGVVADSRVFARVLHLQPARWKLLPLNSLTAVRVSTGSLAVAPVHHFRLDDEATDTVVEVVSFTANGISMLEATADDAMLQALRTHGQKWEMAVGSGDGGTGGANVLVIKGQPQQTLDSSDVLRQLFAQRAFPHTATRWTVLRSDRCTSFLFLLQGSGLVDSIDSLVTPGFAASWQFTAKGLRSVLTCSRLGVCSPLCDVRLGTPLRDRSAYELQLMLRDGGWTWHPLPGPRTTARRELQAYSVEGPLHWFARPSGQSFAVAREYLLCLLDAEVLKRDHGVDEIPHGLLQNTYALFLQGIPIAQHPPLPAPACHERLCLEPDYGDGDDNDDEAAPGAAAAEEPEEDAAEEEQEEQLGVYMYIYIYTYAYAYTYTYAYILYIYLYIYIYTYIYVYTYAYAYTYTYTYTYIYRRNAWRRRRPKPEPTKQQRFRRRPSSTDFCCHCQGHR